MRANSKAKPFVDPVSLPVYVVLCGITILCVLLLMIRFMRLDHQPFRFLLWNLFLAWLPVILSLFAVRLALVARGVFLALCLMILGAGWLLLYPNAPYLTTDFIHLIGEPYDPNSLLVWFDLIVFFLFSWCGLLLGYVSLRHFHALVTHFTNLATGWLFVLSVSFLGGFGVYLGRVIRLNSWDVLFSPFRLIVGVAQGLNRDAVIFTGLFGLLIFILYLSLYALRREPSK